MFEYNKNTTIDPIADPAINSVPYVEIMSQSPKLFKIKDLADDVVGFAERRYLARQTDQRLGPITGFTRLDEKLGDTLCPGLHIIHGGPGVGKTAFALQIAAFCGCPCLYVTCEMQPIELARRIMARCCGKFLGMLKNGSIQPDEYSQLFDKTADSVPQLGIIDSSVCGVPIFAGDSEGIYESACAVRGKSEYLLVIVDSLHSWVDMAYDNDSEYERINRGLADLRTLSVKLGCPIICISERNRMSSEKGGLSAGAGSRKIEYGAETIIELDAAQLPIVGNEWKVKLKVSKNRNGVAGSEIDMRFHGALQRFHEETY